MRAFALWSVLVGSMLSIAGCSRDRMIEQEVLQRRVAFTITARGLCSEYAENGNNADERFKGRVVRVRGRVSQIGRDFVGGRYLILDETDPGSGVRCLFSPDHAPRLARMLKGDRVTVMGRCDGRDLGVTLRGCVLR